MGLKTYGITSCVDYNKLLLLDDFTILLTLPVQTCTLSVYARVLV